MMKHPFVHLMLDELEACLSVMPVVVGVMIIAGLIATGKIHMPLEWLRCTSFSDYILPALLLAMFAVADSLWKVEFRSHVSHA